MCFNESLVWQPCTERHWLHFPYNEACINIFATFSYTRVIYNRYRNIFPSRNDNHLLSPTCISSQEALSRIPLAVNTSVTNHTCCLPPSALVSHCWWPPNGFFFSLSMIINWTMSLTGLARWRLNFRAHSIVRKVNPRPSSHLNYRGEHGQ